ncbi:MAG TPA: carotenoid biosynthesis protein [Edaphobacter sp.]
MTGISAKLRTPLLWAALAVYVLARLCQLYADKLPTLLIVLLHVIPPATFALVHGRLLYRWKGILAFTACCLGFGAFFESLSLRTGFPFGHYYFTGVMGPKLFDLPILLVLAYLGVGYLSWTLGLLILRYTDQPLIGHRVILLPLLASFIMSAWDLSMDPDWSTIDRAWIWHNGGAYFGVPLTNFLGWYLTAFLFYLAFALYCRSRSLLPVAAPRSNWNLAILFYAIVAAGNLLIQIMPMAPPVVTDPSGRSWLTASILEACALISIAVMLPIALLAWFNVKRMPKPESVDSLI